LLTKRDNVLIAVLGPTAVGKTAIAILLAQHFGAEIISADSRQFYKRMPIGTAQPDKDELAAIKHHFIDFLTVETNFSAGQFEQAALQKLEDLFKKSKIAVVAGGSGLYVNALLEGLDEMPNVKDGLRDELIQAFEENGIEYLQELLKAKDPKYYEEVDENNPHRLIRGLEVVMSTGKSILDFRGKPKKQRPFKVIKVGLQMEREQLYERINLRVDKMLEAGLENEAKSFYEKKNLNALQTVGYQELFSFFDGEIDKAEAIRLIKRNTRRFAKRQLTWLRKDEEINWFEPKDSSKIIAFIQEQLDDYL